MSSSPPSRLLALIDLSGTLHVGDEPIRGAVDAIQKLMMYRDEKLDVLFLTNTTTVSKQTLHSKLQQMGFPSSMQLSDIMTSAQSVKYYIQQHHLNPYCLVEPDMLQHDLCCINQDDDDSSSYNSVLIGLSPDNFQYPQLNRAFRILKRFENNDCCRLLAFHRSNYIRDSNNQLSLGPGGFVSLLEHTTNHKALVLGKPSVGFYEAAVQHCKQQQNTNNNTNYSKIIMVGDDYNNDILGAWGCPKITETILVQTGKYSINDEAKLTTPPSHIQRHQTLPSIVQAVEYIVEQCK